MHRPSARTIDVTPFGIEELIRRNMGVSTTLNNLFTDRTLAIHLVHENMKEELVDFLTPGSEGMEYTGVFLTLYLHIVLLCLHVFLVLTVP